jgi:hypothetical protein
MGGKKVINANFKEEITCLESSQYFKKIVEGYDLTSKFTQICQSSMILISLIQFTVLVQEKNIIYPSQ